MQQEQTKARMVSAYGLFYVTTVVVDDEDDAMRATRTNIAYKRGQPRMTW